MSRLPEPDAQALAQSQALSTRIAQEIRAVGGWISFERYMELVLYYPGFGYYSGPSRKFGRGGDFVTAPMMGDTLARALVNQFAQWRAQAHLAPRVLEFGAGNGQLAADFLRLWQECQTTEPALEYQILELSADLAEQQRVTLQAQVPWAMERISWLTEMPASVHGLVLGNEVLDAMPCLCWEKGGPEQGGEWLERGVELEASGFRWSQRPADASLSNTLASLEAQLGARFAMGYQSELQGQAQAWIASLAARLEAAAVVLLDYGFDAAQYYAAARNTGTLMCHYRHHAHEDPFFLPGLQDVTTHVDFSAMWRAATDAGMDLLGYVAQANFLMDAQALRTAPLDACALEAAQHHQNLLRLTAEHEMGELFKVIAFAKGAPALFEAPSLAFARGDRSGYL
jgi:SAM-dependent MidA family methyltransferase